MGKQYGHKVVDGKPIVAKLPKGSTEDTRTVKGWGLGDTLRTLAGR